MRSLILLLCLFLFSFSVSAQSGTMYSLRQPTAEEFLSIIEHEYYWPQLGASRNNLTYIPPAPAILKAEYHQRFGDTFPHLFDFRYEYALSQSDGSFEDMYSRYVTLPYASAYLFDNDNLEKWQVNLILLWLEANNIDLDTVEEVELPSLTIGSGAWITIDVVPHDFNQDGQNEWLLDMGAFLVLGQAGHSYYPLNLGLSWPDPQRDYWDYRNGSYTELAFEDITGDSSPEWIFTYFGGAGGNSTRVNLPERGEVFVFSWQDGQLINILQTPIIYALHQSVFTDFLENPSWEFVNLDDDAALEIVHHPDHEPNFGWACFPNEVSYDWNGEIYIVSSSIPVENPECYQPTPTVPASSYTPSPEITVFYLMEEATKAFEERDYEMALISLNLAIEILPIPNAYYARAITLEALNRPEEALRDYVHLLNQSRDTMLLNEKGEIRDWPGEFLYYLALVHLDVSPPFEIPPREAGG